MLVIKCINLLELAGNTPYTVTYAVNNWMEHGDDNLGIFYRYNMASIEVVLYTHSADSGILHFFLLFVRDTATVEQD